MTEQQLKLGLGLGGGSIRGFAHIGVMKALEEAGIRIDCIAGTSAGSAMGGIYAAGMSAEKMAWFMPSLNMKQVMSPRPRLEGFSDGKEYRTLVELLTRHKNIEETVIPYRAVAVDLISRQRVVLDHGPIGMAVQASSAIPGVFAPVEWEDMLLADGYLLSQVPTDVAKSLGADVVIGVDVGSRVNSRPKHIVDIVSRALSIATSLQVPLEADLVIKPITHPVADFDFDAAQDCVDMGLAAGREVVPEVKRLLGMD